MEVTRSVSNSHEPTQGTAIFTACSVNYLPKAVAMCLSAIEHEPSAFLFVVLVDGKRELDLGDPRIQVIWAEDLNFPEYLKCAFKYNIIEFNTALKPWAALHLMASYEKVIYLDPDVCVFASLTVVHDALDNHTSVFTPHTLSPYVGSGRPSDLDLLRFGSSNLGFFAVRRSKSAEQLLFWWHLQCHSYCYYDPHIGLGVDQKWIDLAAAFFEGVGLVKDTGLNVAFWNLHERTLSCIDGRWMVNGVTELRFIHFSSFVDTDLLCVADKQTRYSRGSRPDFSSAAEVYSGYLQRAKALIKVKDMAYHYSRFDNGFAISPALRRFYAVSARMDVVADVNPFSSEGKVFSYARKNSLISSKTATLEHVSFKSEMDYSRQKLIIRQAFRLALTILGPDRYFSLMRYLAYYSSILHQGDLLRK